MRNQTRKAERSGLTTAHPEAPRGLVGRFYEPFAINMRDLGSPVHAKRFFEVAADVWGGQLSVKLALLDGRPVGGLIARWMGRRTASRIRGRSPNVSRICRTERPTVSKP